MALTRLRRIGWDFWDPIGIRTLDDQAWRARAADEYDLYLLHAAKLLRGGAPSAAAAEYLDSIAADWMGLGPATDERRAASVRTVDAIAALIREPSDPATAA